MLSSVKKARAAKGRLCAYIAQWASECTRLLTLEKSCREPFIAIYVQHIARKARAGLNQNKIAIIQKKCEYQHHDAFVLASQSGSA